MNIKKNLDKSQEKKLNINNYFQDEFNNSINEKANVWKNLKQGSIKIAQKFLKSGNEKEKKRGLRIFNCGNYLKYGFDLNDFYKVANYNNSLFEKLYKMGNTIFDIKYETTIKAIEDLTKKKEIKQHFKKAHFCKNRLCPICQWRNSLKKRAEMYEILPKIKEENPSLRYLFLTLTIKNCYMNELKETIKKLNQGLRKMLKDKTLRFVKGSIKSLEITQGKSEKGTAHPHIHLLLAVSSTYFKGCNYLTHEKWIELWKRYLDIDYDPQVNIQAVSNDPKINILRELLKTSMYIEKESIENFDEDLFIQYSREVENSRTYELTGIFKEYRKKRNIKIKENNNLKIDEETGELIDLDDLVNSVAVEYIDKTYKYKYDKGIVNKFLDIANNHLELLKILKKSKEVLTKNEYLTKKNEINKEETEQIIKEYMKMIREQRKQKL